MMLGLNFSKKVSHFIPIHSMTSPSVDINIVHFQPFLYKRLAKSLDNNYYNISKHIFSFSKISYVTSI